jgi:hypothetical protein
MGKVARASPAIQRDPLGTQLQARESAGIRRPARVFDLPGGTVPRQNWVVVDEFLAKTSSRVRCDTLGSRRRAPSRTGRPECTRRCEGRPGEGTGPRCRQGFVARAMHLPHREATSTEPPPVQLAELGAPVAVINVLGEVLEVQQLLTSRPDIDARDGASGSRAARADAEARCACPAPVARARHHRAGRGRKAQAWPGPRARPKGNVAIPLPTQPRRAGRGNRSPRSSE